MLDSVTVGLSGLTTFSTGLRNISNNVSNVNSSGYKGTTIQFSDLFYKTQLTYSGGNTQSYFSEGSGVGIRSQGTDFSQGDLQQTNSDTDLAITGDGFFILRQGDQTAYTRDGSFQFDDQGFLIDPSTKARVAGLAENNTLEDINIADFHASPAKATSDIKLTGNLSVNDSDGVQTISDVPVFDASGGSNPVTITLTQDTTAGAKNWTVAVTDQAGNSLGTSSDVQFAGDGSPLAGFNTVAFAITPTGGGAAQSVTLDFGTPGTFSGVTNFSAGTDSTAAVGSQDGFGVGVLQKTTFDAQGVLTLTYSNGQTVTDGRVALAHFDDMQQLTRSDGARFLNTTGLIPEIGAASSGGFGSISGDNLEAANVDLAKEFSELVIIQRGYQSASQVISAANDMAQQVLDMVKHP